MEALKTLSEVVESEAENAAFAEYGTKLEYLREDIQKDIRERMERMVKLDPVEFGVTVRD